ncbi:ion transporter [Schleiferilactobacillus harbinensis]|uniref:Potassium ion channel protein n=1 Tax=Schleiferilactobacillus harbinensis DSM 16991 TaxID=1122147 RepID=A0A0R1X0K7_9LACO|nr:ion transporter [Schleiferilactobacillus harbinensis]KRM23601.1 Potassium ion channel protein [Schleiferilactobacillus harbinensis DSM 16991]MCT2907951.1 ion transporter [Schleiferilactobacillus harbinensis]QFR64518.1 ion transporter [Schleiferilactobacillus harbinensis]
MQQKRLKRAAALAKRYYTVAFALLAIISIILIVLDYMGRIDIDAWPYALIDNGILIVFAIDYICRFIRAKDKWHFFKHNLIDLLAIIPFNYAFSLFRFARIFRLVRLTRLFRLTRFARLAGIIGMLTKKQHAFLHRSGLIYYLWLSLALILVGAGIYSITEGTSYGNSVWWAIVTATTVGYGDISPHTILGRITAVILMFNGIGLISALTSAVTMYLASDDPDTGAPQAMSIADEIRQFHDLADDGIITASEFEQQKRRLLALHQADRED